MKDEQNLPETIIKILNSVIEQIENPLKQKRPDVKGALLKIEQFRSICQKMEKEFEREHTLSKTKNEISSTHQPYSYKCLYQCGFTTKSIREIDIHLMEKHGHPDPNRDYNHPIYNEI